MVTSRFVLENLGRLQDRHYVLKSAHPTRLGSHHVAPTPSRIRDHQRRFGGDFALILVKSTVDNEDFYVVPFGRIEQLLSPDRATSKDCAWNVQIAEEALWTAEDHVGAIPVAPCHGSEPLAKAIIEASVAHDADEDAVRGLLRELAVRERREHPSHLPRRVHPLEPMDGEMPPGTTAILSALDATPRDRNSLCRATEMTPGAGKAAIDYLRCTGHAVQVGVGRGTRYVRRAGT